MWLVTTDGFFSAVEDRDDATSVFVRARAREDAQRLADALSAAVIETPDADYRFRVRLSRKGRRTGAAGLGRAAPGRPGQLAGAVKWWWSLTRLCVVAIRRHSVRAADLPRR